MSLEAGTGRFLSLRVERVPGETSARPVVHIAVAKKLVPLATRRNRIKRFIREAIRNKVRLQAGRLYRIRTGKPPVELDYAVVENQIIRVFKEES